MEEFFLSCGRLDEFDVKDLLLSRYGSTLEDLPIYDFIMLVNKAKEKVLDDRIYFRWVMESPHMQEPMSYNEYKDKLTGANIDTRKTEDILLEIEQKREKYKKGDVKNGS